MAVAGGGDGTISYFTTTTALKLCWCSCAVAPPVTFCDSLTNTYHDWLYGGIQIGH